MIIKVVPDTNLLIRGMLGYKSPQRAVLNLALARKIVMYGSKETLDEFCEKVYMPRFKKYWDKKIFSPEKIILDYKALVSQIEPSEEYKDMEIEIRDPDDAIFIKVAKTVNSKIIISEDKDLMVLKKVDDVRIVTAEQFLAAIGPRLQL